jgi:adenosylmethionine-8-amino-7-oxononanoate aminotransferase
MSIKQQLEIETLEQWDKRYLWHPFTQMTEWQATSPLIITEGKGAYLKDSQGRWYLDGVSSLWANLHGHCHEVIDRALKAQIDRVAHSTFLGLTHEPGIVLAQRLISIAPKGLTRVFYSDNGSTAVEIALKMAYQYFQLMGKKNKNRFLALKNGYHGDTIGAVSVGGIALFHQIFSPLLFQHYQTASPYCYRCEFDYQDSSRCSFACLTEMEKTLEANSETIAAAIVEPMVQGAGGMIVYPNGFLSEVQRLCGKYNVLLIADEVATGFGRTGKMFACEHENVHPDILCLAKGITGGYLPLSATMTSEEIYSAFLGRYEDYKTFFHGHTYTGNQLACACANASLTIFEQENTLAQLRDKITVLRNALASFSAFRHVGDVRQLGFMVGIELVQDKDTKKPFPPQDRIGRKVCDRATEQGLIIRPLGDVVVLMPPLCVSVSELERIVEITANSINSITSKNG